MGACVKIGNIMSDLPNLFCGSNSCCKDTEDTFW